MNNKITGLFIGRFQPVHLGTLDAIKQAVEKGVSNLIFGVGSADKELTENNPFNYLERQEMLRLFGIEIGGIIGFNQNHIFPITDFGNDDQWYNYIITCLPKFDCVITGNPHVKKIFNSRGVPTIDLKERVMLKASHIRMQIALSNIQELEKSLPKSIINYLIQINAFERLKKILSKNFVQPRIAVDGIIEDEDGNIILIERKYPPFGYALPGGMVEYGESFQDALKREMKEELNIDIEIIGDQDSPFMVRSDPQRDIRGHVISIIYKAVIVGGKLKAGDDAKNYILASKFNLCSLNLCFDHGLILQNYINN